MKRSKWPLLVGALLVGALAGVALAGRPTSLPSVVIPASTAAESTTTVAEPSTTVAPSSTTSAATSTTAPASTAVTTTIASTTTKVAPTRVADIVAVNGTGKAGVAGRAADRLLQAGWPAVITDDARNQLTTSRVMAKPGFEDEARLAAADLGLTVEVEPYSNSIATIDDATGDVMVFLGADVNF
jgi:cytoskeletal protein RodZ